MKRQKTDLCKVGFYVLNEGLISVRFFKRSDASRANVTVGFLSVFHVGNFLYVYFERSSRFTIGVADVVARSLTFTANIAYSRHIDTSDFGIILPYLVSDCSSKIRSKSTGE